MDKSLIQNTNKEDLRKEKVKKVKMDIENSTGNVHNLVELKQRKKNIINNANN